MKRILFLLMLLASFSHVVSAKDKDKMPQYEISGAGSGIEGTILVKVYIYDKNTKDADLKRAAVHGVVFRGCSGNQSGAKQPAMASPKAETDNVAYCSEFFAIDGECQNYASVIEGSYDRVKTAKGYKVGAILQVDKTSLRKELEKAGVVRSLSSGF